MKNENNKILTKLPESNGRIHWKSTVGMNVKILYHSTEYLVKITYFDSKEKSIYVKYLDFDDYKMAIYSFRSCQFKKLLRIKYSKKNNSFQKTSNDWSEYEENILKEKYENTCIEDIMKLIPYRSERGIKHKANRMGLYQNLKLLYVHTPEIYKNIDNIIYKKCKECGEWLEMNNDNFWKDNVSSSGYKNTCKKCLVKNVKCEGLKNINELQHVSGIYKITNLANGVFYIGSAMDLIHRKETHLSKLKSNKHENKYLQRAFNKYGEENFKFEIIEIVEDKNKLLEREQCWIDITNCCDRKIGYNICTIAGNQMGVIVSEETKEKQRNNSKRKEVVQCDMNGHFIREWRSVREVARQIGLTEFIVRKPPSFSL